MTIATLANVGEILAWASVFANLWWFHRRISRLEGRRTICRIEVSGADPDRFKLPLRRPSDLGGKS